MAIEQRCKLLICPTWRHKCRQVKPAITLRWNAGESEEKLYEREASRDSGCGDSREAADALELQKEIRWCIKTEYILISSYLSYHLCHSPPLHVFVLLFLLLDLLIACVVMKEFLEENWRESWWYRVRRGRSTPQGCSLYVIKPDVTLEMNQPVVLCCLRCSMQAMAAEWTHILKFLFRASFFLDLESIFNTVIFEDTEVGVSEEDAGDRVN